MLENGPSLEQTGIGKFVTFLASRLGENAVDVVCIAVRALALAIFVVRSARYVPATCHRRPNWL